MLMALCVILAAVSGPAAVRTVSTEPADRAGGTPDLALSFRPDRAPPAAVPAPAPPQGPGSIHLPASLFVEALSAQPVAAPAPPMPPAPPADRREPAWLRYAVPAPPGEGPMVAIVIDDFGLDRANAARALALPAPLTLSIMAYARGAQGWADAAHRAGHEVMLHMRMV
ncbi:MAG: divergent polysaccharide deacetylase family protein, partial [Rhodospirillaceae bacterium]|nr:divergent polysaccharide deacetylase family protein [Rhodospirillaceae bacterium]